MITQDRYEKAKGRLLGDASICDANRDLFREFLDYEEYKLKRINSLPALDAACLKTLIAYLTRFRTVNRWFDNKPWRDLTEADIKAVYDGLEDGRIRRLDGQPFRDKETYYRHIIRGKPFDFAGKRALAVKAMPFYQSNGQTQVRFIKEATFRELVASTIKPEHKALLWLAWDIGENVMTLLQLRPTHLCKQTNPDTGDPEYLINLPREILKRSRTPRSEITNYAETVQVLDSILRQRARGQALFPFGPHGAKKAMDRAVRITGTRCIPGGQKVTLKDLRSSMAYDLLSKGWTTDEVNRRLGHKPSSREIDKYVNFLALDRHRPKKRANQFQFERLVDEIERLRQREKLHREREERLAATVAELQQSMQQLSTGNKVAT